MSTASLDHFSGGVPSRPITSASLRFYAICRFIVVGVSRILFPGAVIGRENLPTSGPFILAPVHRSNIDWLIVARVTKRRLRYLVKDEVWKVKPVGRLLVLLGAFPVHRGSADREAFSRALEVLAGGEPLVLFPEGTRRSGPAVEKILEGAAYIAIRAAVPILPVGLAGTEQAMPRGKKLIRPSRVRIVIGEAIPPPKLDRDKTVQRRGVSRRIPRSVTDAHSTMLATAMQEAFAKATTQLASSR